jgi:hypothetical protein
MDALDRVASSQETAQVPPCGCGLHDGCLRFRRITAGSIVLRGAIESEDIMLHTLTATIGTLAILASLNIKLACYRRSKISNGTRNSAASGAMRPPAHPANPGSH